MYGVVPVTRRSLDELRDYVGEQAIEELRSVAAPLRGARVLNLSLSPFGTGLSELLHSLVPLLRDLGLEADWHVPGGAESFGVAARLIYDGLGGKRVALTPRVLEKWERYNDLNAREMEQGYDIVVVHDPQPVGLPARLGNGGGKAGGSRWIWHCHMDLRRARLDIWAALLRHLQYFDACVFQDADFLPGERGGIDPVVIPPAIDPAGSRSMPLSDGTIRQLLGRYGLDPVRPLLVQVGSFDAAFDPMGAIDVYRSVKRSRADLQFLMVHPLAENSLDGWSKFERVARHLGVDGDARVLVSQGDGGDLIVNAAQRAATVVMQRSVPAGFSLPVWEAQWKERPVVVGGSGALPRQVASGETGYVAEDEESFVRAITEIMDDPGVAARMGGAGRRRVQDRHLITSFLADTLRLMKSLVAAAPSSGAPSEAVVRAGR